MNIYNKILRGYYIINIFQTSLYKQKFLIAIMQQNTKYFHYQNTDPYLIKSQYPIYSERNNSLFKDMVSITRPNSKKQLVQSQIIEQNQYYQIKSLQNSDFDQLLRIKSMDRLRDKVNVNPYQNQYSKLNEDKNDQSNSNGKRLTNNLSQLDNSQLIKFSDKKPINLKRLIQNYKKFVQKLSQENNELKKQNRILKNELDQLNKISQQYLNITVKIQNDLKLYKHEIENRDMQINYLKNASEALIDKVDLINQNFELKKQLEKYKGENKNLIEINQNLQKRITKETKFKKQLQQIIFQLHCQISFYKKHMANYQQCTINFQENHKKFKQKIIRLRNIQV